MFNKWISGKRTMPKLGIYLKENEVVLVQCAQSNSPKLQCSARISGVDGWKSALRALVSEHHLEQSRCQIILHNSLYQKFTLEKPQVDEQELMPSILWKLKELINEPLHEIVCDYFDLPSPTGSTPRINVITTPKKRISELSTLTAELKLHLCGITTDELALCNLPSEDDRPTLLLFQEPEDELALLTIKNGQLLFQRRIRGFGQLPSLKDGITDPSLIDNLSLEIQRSLDYLISQLKLSNIKALQVAIPTPALPLLCAALDEMFVQSVIPFEFPGHLTGSELIAWGGAMEIRNG